jgi:hypothetical protein
LKELRKLKSDFGELYRSLRRIAAKPDPHEHHWLTREGDAENSATPSDGRLDDRRSNLLG